MPADAPEDTAVLDLGRLEPGSQRSDRTGLGREARENRTGVADRLLVGLAPPDRDEQPALGELEVAHLESNELASPTGRRKPNEKERTIPEPLQR